jgi:ectoine hydroxylase-related dioxygenase (phytanoyl-CoA dioxygenase family)
LLLFPATWRRNLRIRKRLSQGAGTHEKESILMQTTEISEHESGYKALTQAQVASFWEDGFLVVGKVLQDELIEEMRREYDDEFSLERRSQRPIRNLAVAEDDHDHDEGDQQEMLQFMQISEHNLQFHQLTYHEGILDIIEDLIGPNIQQFHNQALNKPPHHGGPIFWHQDNAYWKCLPANLVSCWLTLDDVDLHNGAMQFIPGSHLRPMIHDQAQGSDVLLDMGKLVDDSKAVVGDLPAGGITLHHCQTLHRTAPNTTDRQRRALAIHFMTPGTKSARTDETIPVCFSHPMLRMRV